MNKSAGSRLVQPICCKLRPKNACNIVKYNLRCMHKLVPLIYSANDDYSANDATTVSMTAQMMSAADIDLQMQKESSFGSWGSENSASMSLSNSLSCALENSMKLWQVLLAETS